MARPTFCWMLVLTACLFATQIRANSMEDDYVRQVIEEDQQHYGDHYNDHTQEDDAYHEHDEQQEYVDEEERRRDTEEQAVRDASDRIAADRERKFQAELDRIDDEEQKKMALKQKRIDGRKVRSVLKAAERNDLYKVLGLRNLTLRIPPFHINIAGAVKFTIPGLTILRGATKDEIKKQFRQRAIQIHPDKNRDGRAQEAFVAVQNAASILTDEDQRMRYDAEWKAYKSDKLESHKKLVATSLAAAWAIARKIVMMAQTLLGPFFVPVLIIGALII
jgi:hypothetical protein